MTNRSEPTGRLLALQIKSGKSFFRKRGENFVYYGEARHLRYWRRHSLPVAIILHNPETGLTLWQRVEEDQVEYGRTGNWSIEVLPAQVLDATAAEGLEKGVSDIAAYRKLRLTFDVPLMKEFAEKGEVFFSIDEWVNKSLGFRDCHVFFDEGELENGEPDHVIGAWFPGHSIGEYFANVWPWLSYEYIADIPPHAGWDEVEAHQVRVELNEIGKAFLTLEDFYANGAEVVEPEIPEPEAVYDEVAEEFYNLMQDEKQKEGVAAKPDDDHENDPLF